MVGHFQPQTELEQHGFGHALVDGVVLDQQHAPLQPADRRAGMGFCKHLVHSPGRGDGDQHLVQVGTTDGFVQGTQYAQVGAVLLVGGGIGGTEHHEPRRGQRRFGLDGRRKLKTVHGGHVHVENGQIKCLFFAHSAHHCIQRLHPALDAGHVHVPALQLVQQNVPVGRVVVHHQGPQALQCSAVHGRGDDRAGQRQAQIDDERRALALHTLHPHRTPHQLQQALADCQPQPGAAVLACGGAVCLREMLEDLLAGFGRNANPGVFHADAHCSPVVVVPEQRNPHHHFTFFGELDGVADQVADHLPQAERVAAQRQWRIVRNDLHGQFQPLDFGRLRKHGHSVLYRIGQAEVDLLQLHVA